MIRLYKNKLDLLGGLPLNKSVTSKEELLEAAKNIAYTEGLNSINIRSVAKKCNVSIGSIYNYFPTKSDLVLAVVEDFWNYTCIQKKSYAKDDEKFTEFFERYFKTLSKRLFEFENDWLAQISMLSVQDKEKGRKLESKCFDHLKHQLSDGIDKDGFISKDLWNEDFTKGEFIDFVFFNLISMLRYGKDDCRFFIAILEQILYN